MCPFRLDVEGLARLLHPTLALPVPGPSPARPSVGSRPVAANDARDQPRSAQQVAMSPEFQLLGILLEDFLKFFTDFLRVS